MVELLRDFGDADLLPFDFEPYIKQTPMEIALMLMSQGDLVDSPDICRFYLRGTCQKGRECTFRHSKTDKLVVCKHWLRGLCKKNENCEFLHEYDLSKMPPCQFYSQFGECSNADCIFRHINPGDNVAECPFYTRGFCRLGFYFADFSGPNCRFKHTRQTLCLNYLEGFCPKGKDCEFGHAKWVVTDIDLANGPFMPRGPISCHQCGQQGHKASACPNEGQQAPPTRPQRDLSEITCFKCNQTGHYANACPLPRGAGSEQESGHGQSFGQQSQQPFQGYGAQQAAYRQPDNYGQPQPGFGQPSFGQAPFGQGMPQPPGYPPQNSFPPVQTPFVMPQGYPPATGYGFPPAGYQPPYN